MPVTDIREGWLSCIVDEIIELVKPALVSEDDGRKKLAFLMAWRDAVLIAFPFFILPLCGLALDYRLETLLEAEKCISLAWLLVT